MGTICVCVCVYRAAFDGLSVDDLVGGVLEPAGKDDALVEIEATDLRLLPVEHR